jgi:hypothetical protein
MGAAEETRLTPVVADPPTANPDDATQLRRRKATKAWAIAVMSWAVVRTLVVWAALGGYGINPWIYLVVDLGCASVDAITTPKMVIDFADGRYLAATGWAVVSFAAFLTPDVYIFYGTRTLPIGVVIAVVTVVGITLSAAIISVRRKVLAERARRDSPQTQPVAP